MFLVKVCMGIMNYNTSYPYNTFQISTSIYFKWGSSKVIQQFKELCFPSEVWIEKQESKQVIGFDPLEVCMIGGRQICQELLGYRRGESNMLM